MEAVEEASQQQIGKSNFILLLCQVWDGGGEGGGVRWRRGGWGGDEMEADKRSN